MFMLLSTRQIAEALGLSEQTLREMRSRRWVLSHPEVPPFPEVVQGYDSVAVAQWVDAVNATRSDKDRLPVPTGWRLDEAPPSRGARKRT